MIDERGAVLGVKEAWRSLPPWPAPRRGPTLAALGDPALALLETNYLATTSNIAFRKEVLAAPGAPPLAFRELRYCHDWDFFLGLARRGELAVVEEPLVRYRVHSRNTLKETEDVATARMRFEILWLLARHAHPLLGRAVRRRGEGERGGEDLRRRLWASLPHFGAETLLLTLLAWRGTEARAGDGYDRLLAADHPFRLQAEEVLRSRR